jgi:hypothetical protein
MAYTPKWEQQEREREREIAFTRNVHEGGSMHLKARPVLCLINEHSTEAYGGAEVSLHEFLTSALNGG